MILPIVKYPEPVLQKPGEPVTEFDSELRKFVADMFETMYASQGIGLAAQQVGVAKRVTVIVQMRIHLGGRHRFIRCINR